MSAGSLLNKVENYYLPAKQYAQAEAALELLGAALRYDSDELLKRRNITTENLLYIKFRTCYGAYDLNIAKELGD